jgi:putative transposase
MGRAPRSAVGGIVYHVLNRANARARILRTDGDYQALERILEQAAGRYPVRVLAYCLMPNHWHLVLHPEEGADGALSAFMHWITLTHTQRWHAHRDSSGTGHLYQGRFKSFPVQDDGHFLTVCRYVERNPLRAGLVERAEEWHWSSLWRRESGSAQQKAVLRDWPVARPRGWLSLVNGDELVPQLAEIRECLCRGRPYGDESWATRTARRLGLGLTLRPRGRPRLDRSGEP